VLVEIRKYATQTVADMEVLVVRAEIIALLEVVE
jgi:hypothetical protein